MYCEKCGAKFTESEQSPEHIEPPVPEPTFTTDPKEVLNEVVMIYVKAGYQVISRTDTTAQLTRKKDFSAGKAVAFGLLYVASRASKKDPSAFVSVNPDGSYQVIDENGRARVFESGKRIEII